MTKSRKCLVLLSIVSAGAVPLADTAAGATYKAVKQFSIKANPNSVWTYLYSGGLLPDATKTANGVKGLIG